MLDVLHAEKPGGSPVCPWENLQSISGLMLAAGCCKGRLESAIMLEWGTARVPSQASLCLERTWEVLAHMWVINGPVRP